MTQPGKAPLTVPPGIELRGPRVEGDEQILTEAALAFVASLVRAFRPRVGALLEARKATQARFDAGELPRFSAETAEVRAGTWRVAPLPADLQDRRVEITGPVDRKMIINALNSGASCFMADFEDSNTPTWENQVAGQINLFEAIRRTISFEAPETGKRYQLNDKVATLLVRPRGWHLPERHVLVDGEIAPGSLVDFGLFFFHNARELLSRGTGPYFYLPKLEHHLEARLWNDVFVQAQAALGIKQGTIKATVLIETLPAAFQMDEILYELREHSAGLNCGRWDYIFSFIKKLRNDASRVFPDRGQVTMDKAFLRAYSLLLIKTCHRRGVHAMGGMAAQIPIKGDAQKNAEALDRVRADKLREVRDGHDGTWVAHPGLVEIAKGIFDEHMKTPNQIERVRDDVTVSEADLVTVHEGNRTEAGLRHNVRVGIQYIEAWLRGSGCVPIYNLMEDAATAEICRAQTWQWLKHGADVSGEKLTEAFLRKVVDEELERVKAEVGEARFAGGRFAEATDLFLKLATSPTFEEFLTVPAYRLLADLSITLSVYGCPATLPRRRRARVSRPGR